MRWQARPFFGRWMFVLLLAAALLAGCFNRPTEQAAGQPSATPSQTSAPAYPIPGQLFPAPEATVYPLPGEGQAVPTLPPAYPEPLSSPQPLPSLPPYPEPLDTQPAPTLTPTSPSSATSTQAAATATETPALPEEQPTETPVAPEVQPTDTSEPTETPTETVTPTIDPYPLPPTLPAAYPPPGENTATATTAVVNIPTLTSPAAYPPPGVGTPTRTPTHAVSATSGPSATASPTATSTPNLAATQAALTPTEHLARPLGTATPSAGLRAGLTIWHSWDRSQREVLQQAIRAFQGTFPDVTFDVLYVPADDLQARYEQAAYHGGGPSLVLGSSDWAASFYDQGLVADLRPYMSPEFEASLAAPALLAGRYRGAQTGLPYAMQGVLLYRNTELLPEAATDWQELLQSAAQATRGGRLGLYFDWSPYFSGGILQTLGGQWAAEDGQPLFQQDQYAAALAWLELMQQAAGKTAGGVEADQIPGAIQLAQAEAGQLFSAGRVGVIFDASARLNTYRQALGAEKLALDPWPVYQGQSLGGFVQTEQLYLNAIVAERSSAEQRAALIFMGMFMTPEIQARLAEVGFIPTALLTEVRDAHLRQAQVALQQGTAFPPVWQGEIRSAYWSGMIFAAQNVIAGYQTPQQALEALYQDLQARLPVNP